MVRGTDRTTDVVWPSSIYMDNTVKIRLTCLTNASSTTGTSNVTLEAKMIIVKGLIDANSACVCIMATCHT